MGRANATACYRELGAELRKRRETARVSATTIAEETGWDRSKISRMETGNANISTIDLIFYLAACGIHRAEERDELLEFCRTAANSQGYWLSPNGEWLEDSLVSLVFHESTAGRTISYEPMLVPGLLQTTAYARVRILRSAAFMSRSPEEAIRIREERQKVLYRQHPAEFVFFVHEQALRNQVGDTRIMHEQLLHMVLLAALGHVTLRIIPAAREPSVFGGPFRLFEHPKHAPLLYLDNVLTGVFIEGHDVVGAYYRHLLPELRAVALGAGESREFAAALADEYDRGSPPDVHVEEEQL